MRTESPAEYKNTHPGHELHKNGEFLLFVVPKATIVLHNAFVAQVLQQLDLTLQSVHLLQTNKQHLQYRADDVWCSSFSLKSLSHIRFSLTLLVS